jgi:hypothetical protein
MIDGVRLATTSEELIASYQLRYKIYIEDMGRLKEKGNNTLKELRDSYDDSARTVVAIKNQKAIGTLRILWGGDTEFDQNLLKTYHVTPFFKDLDKSEICIVERLMVDKNHRGSSTMLRLYKETLRFIIDRKIELLLLASEPNQVTHYQRLGGHVFAKSYLYPGIGPVFPIAQAMGDYQYFEKIRSPFALLTKPGDWRHFHKMETINDIIDSEQAKIHNTSKHGHLSENSLTSPFRQLSSIPLVSENKLQLRIGAA